MLKGTGDMKGSDAAFHGALQTKIKQKASITNSSSKPEKKDITTSTTWKSVPTKTYFLHILKNIDPFEDGITQFSIFLFAKSVQWKEFSVHLWYT